MSLHLGPHRVAERGEGLALVQAHSGGREAEDLEAPPQGPVTAQDKVWLVSPGSWLGPGSGQAGALSGTALLSPRRAGRRLSGQNCAEWRGPTGHRAPGGRNRPRRSCRAASPDLTPGPSHRTHVQEGGGPSAPEAGAPHGQVL